MKRLWAIAIAAMVTMGGAAQVRLEGPPQPKLTNAKAETRPAGDLAATAEVIVRQYPAVWIGYAVPIIPGKRLICCFDSFRDLQKTGCCSGCQLERRNGNYMNSDGGTCVREEAPAHVFILLRAEGSHIGKVRAFTPDCALDGGGLPVVWLTGVDEGQSIALLVKLAKEEPHGTAVMALGLHASPLADKALEQLIISGDSSRRLRDEAAFWLGSQRARAGYLLVQNHIRTHPDARFREHLTFVISESHEPESLGELLRVAKEDRESRVRGQALFWLAQRAGQTAEAAITAAMENDPDLQVKKKAIFALSQLPREEGVPLLIKYADSHPNRAIRKEAIFWLGQSGDPRALDYLEKLLTR